MKTKKSLGIIMAVLVVMVSGIVLTATIWNGHTRDKKITQAFEKAHHLLAKKDPRNALTVLRDIVPITQEKKTEERLAMEIECHLAMGNTPRLLHLNDRYPFLFLKNEAAALFVCRALMQTKNTAAFTALRQNWHGMESDIGAWFALDVDTFLVAGEREAARQMLTSTKFEGKTEATRLIRLALITAPDNLEKAWEYLEEAAVQAPYNSDVHLFQGQILERLKKPASARVEYVAALLSEPENPRIRDQLAEFYRRQGNPQLALATWEEGLTPSAPGYLWLKAIFWSRMVTPLKGETVTEPRLEDPLTPLVHYLDQLPDASSWSDERFFKIPDRTLLVSTRQELFWLRVVNHLARGQEGQALALIEKNPFKAISWHPEIEAALMATLRFRRWGAFPKRAPHPLSQEKGSHPLFKELAASSATPSPAMTALLKSPDAFSAVFLAGGWLEAALSLHRMPKIPAEFPEWFPYGLTQAFRYNRGASEALEFAKKQVDIPLMNLLQAELLLALNKKEEGKTRLKKEAPRPSGVGFRAAWLLTMTLLDEGKTTEARKTLVGQPLLVQSLIGRELMARIAVSEGNTAEATRLYTRLVAESEEARVWLARQAFAEKRWDEARRLTLELASAHPDSLQFRANLMAIQSMEGAP